MPKSNLVTNYDKIFHDNLEFQFIKENVLKKSIAERVGVDRSTIGRQCKDPDRMTLLELKTIIKMAKVPKEVVLEFLYEGR